VNKFTVGIDEEFSKKCSQNLYSSIGAGAKKDVIIHQDGRSRDED
jgi:hypothetical protein